MNLYPFYITSTDITGKCSNHTSSRHNYQFYFDDPHQYQNVHQRTFQKYAKKQYVKNYVTIFERSNNIISVSVLSKQRHSLHSVINMLLHVGPFVLLTSLNYYGKAQTLILLQGAACPQCLAFF